ncbi:MAG TPA: sulfur carrier protein ThiS [Rhodothermales bacterium]|nr:sulfur carrier protein ThiS [Rhodothermales bacterium]
MRIFVNEKAVEIGGNANLIDVLEKVDVQADRRGIAVAVNDRVVRRADWTDHRVEAGDRIEIIQATQGG